MAERKTTRKRTTKEPGSKAPAKAQKAAAKVREAEHEAEVTSMMADSAFIDRDLAEKEAQKPPTFSGADMGNTHSPEEAQKEADSREVASGEDREQREQDAAEAQAKVAELTTAKDADEDAEDLGLRGTEAAPSRVPPDPEQPKSDKSPEELRELAKSRNIFSSADMFGGRAMTPTERKIHGNAKAFEGESDTERKLRAMGLTGPGH